MTCDECGVAWPADRFNLECATPSVCFRCRSKGLAVCYLRYGEEGRKGFHGATTRERQAKIVADGKAQGRELVPRWTKPYTGPANSVLAT